MLLVAYNELFGRVNGGQPNYALSVLQKRFVDRSQSTLLLSLFTLEI